ncbi:hypothetical protein QYM18_20115 [Ectopseudomonas chengduensis]|nr:hypothetical protein [Pseudomonas chengduensis]WKC36738.1 hypothetical protein QYM18_20115 [Pseudomonas chengduensis]
MTSEYIYRLDYTAKLKTFPDRCHRAPRWIGDMYSYPHKLLRSRLDQLNNSQAIYRICFFTTQAKAEEVRLSYKDGGKTTTLARCRKADLPAAGFTDSWDDGFNLGVAHLFWIEESLGEENNTLSTASVPFERFEALVDQKWIPLATHLAPAPRAVPPEADQTQQPRLITEPRLLTCLKRLIGSA